MTREIEENLNAFLASSKKSETFSSLLFSYIDQEGKKDSEIYKKALVSRKVFSKLRCQANYVVSKETAIQLALALELSEEEALRLIKAAGYNLSSQLGCDLVILYCFRNGIYSLFAVNEILLDKGYRPLGERGLK